MEYMVNGRVVEVCTQPDGSVDADQLRHAVGIAPNRQLVLQLPDGSNRTVNPGETLPLGPRHFTDIPNHIRGCCTHPHL